jgi:S-adenosylmethionine decarboxylase
MKAISGTHLIVDGYVKSHAALSINNLYAMFDDLVRTLDMAYLTYPVATKVKLDPKKLGSEQDEGGVSIYCQITTSHIAAHTWPLKRAIMLDVFSCRTFDPDVAFSVIDRWLAFSVHKKYVVQRSDPRHL